MEKKEGTLDSEEMEMKEKGMKQKVFFKIILGFCDFYIVTFSESITRRSSPFFLIAVAQRRVLPRGNSNRGQTGTLSNELFHTPMSYATPQ